MAEYYKISGERLTAIADAIRSKTGKTDALTPEQMAAEINGISVLSKGTANSEFTVNFESSAVGALSE